MMSTQLPPCPTEVGFTFSKEVSWSSEELIFGAKLLGDENPIHSDLAFAQSTVYEDLIACGPFVSGIHACMLPSYFSKFGGVVGIESTVRYEAPVYAGVPHLLAWVVESIQERTKHGGYVISCTGSIKRPHDGIACVTATGNILLRLG
jgi:3-hydroxybutyryl-CoA dehydratase